MPNNSRNFFENRKRKISEQKSYWRFNFRSGAFRYLERKLFHFNVSDILGGDLGQIQHLIEVRKQILRRELIAPAILPTTQTGESTLANFEATLPQYILEIENARVDVLTGLVYLDAGFVIESTLAKWQKVIFRGGIGSAILRAKKSKELQDNVCMVLPYTPYYYHTLIDELPNLLRIRENFPQCNSVIVHKTSEKWVIELLETLKFKVLITAQNAVIAKNLFVITAPRALNKANIELLRKQITPNPKKILIVSRSGAPRSEDNLEEALLKGIPDAELINPGRLSTDEQIELFSSARIIIGLHGGALTNTVWMHEKGKLIEIFNHAYRTRDYEVLSKELGQEYLGIESSERSNDSVVNEVREFIYG